MGSQRDSDGKGTELPFNEIGHKGRTEHLFAGTPVARDNNKRNIQIPFFGRASGDCRCARAKGSQATITKDLYQIDDPPIFGRPYRDICEEGG
jgi:hypothetical protein